MNPRNIIYSIEPLWDEPDEDHLRYLWEVEQLPANQIARRMGRTKGAITGKARRMQLTVRETPIVRRTHHLRPAIEVLTLPGAGHAVPARATQKRRRSAGPMRQSDERETESSARSEHGCLYLTERTSKNGKVRQVPCGEPRLRVRGRLHSYCKEHYTRCCIPPDPKYKL